MGIVITVISILIIAGLIFLFDRITRLRICPICAGVFLTWLWMLGAKVFGYPIDPIIPAMLMGATVTGVAYQLEKRFPQNRFLLLWKTLFIAVGFIAAYSLVVSAWIGFLGATIMLMLITFGFTSGVSHRPAGESATVEELKKKMEECC